MNCWLLKSEGDCYSIDALMRDKKTPWTGIRNYQARNFMRDHMAVGDLCLFYHSNGTTASPTGVYGVAKVVSKAHPDMTAQNRADEHYDLKSSPENPIWQCVDIAYVAHLKHPVYLADIKLDPALAGIMVAAKGSRLSIQPVNQEHFTYIVQEMGDTKL